MTFKHRKTGFFLGTALRRGLHGGILKDGEGHGDGIEVGGGFAEAAARLGGDDTRPESERGGGASQEIPDDDGGENEGGDGEGDGSGEDDEGNPQEKDKKRREREGFKELKRERRELRQKLAAAERERATFEQRLAQLENGGLNNGNRGGNSDDTNGKPDVNDVAKYPLGVLDDGFQNDMIQWQVEQKLNKALESQRQAQNASEENARVQAHMQELRSRVEDLAERGEDLHDDYADVVLEAGLRGDYPLTENTFTAAADEDHGAEILYFLANNVAEARKVAAMTNRQQDTWVREKNAEIAKTSVARKKPGANPPPPNDATPAGRNASRSIRADTDNLDDFRKIWYKNK